MKRALALGLIAVVLGGLLITLFFLAQPPDELAAWLAEPAAPRPPPPPARRAPEACRAMTWGVRGTAGFSVWVGAIEGSTDALQGDTPCAETRHLLCFKPGSAAKPDALVLGPPSRWSGGAVNLVPDVPGRELSSRGAADARCAARFGEGWRMAEFHEAGHGGFGAVGELPAHARFWVANADQRANPWD